MIVVVFVRAVFSGCLPRILLINGINNGTKPDAPMNIPATISEHLYPYRSAIQPKHACNYNERKKK